MSNRFEQEQDIIYKSLKNAIENNKISHAYLFDVSNYDKGYDFVIDFVKNIICKDRFKENHDPNCPLCKTIDDGNYMDLTIINPDGQWIKKDQLDQLQVTLSTKSLLNNYRVYIINGAEYLNASSANSILKFLEEPEENIIAILVTKSINNVLETIKSRCQIFVFKNINRELDYKEKLLSYAFNSLEEKQEFIENNDIDSMISKVVEFAKNFEKRKGNEMIYTYNDWFSIFKDKNQNIFGLNLLLLLYKDVVNTKINKKLDIFTNYSEEIKKICDNNSITSLYKKINLISSAKEKNKININLNLNIDNLIMEMENIYD